MSGSSVSRTERLLNLVIALLSTRAALSRASIQRTVAGYDPEASVAAFERMFERDKDELRGMGVPIRTVTDAHGEVQGYVIDAEEYATRDLNLTVDELAVLNVAAQLWDNAVLESAAVTAVRKLESSIDETVAGPATTFGVLTARDAALLPLLRAVRDGRTVRFEYRKPGLNEATKRTVEPWSLHSRDGHWYLVGADVGHGELGELGELGKQRVFRVSRIQGAVQVLATPVSTKAGSKTEHLQLDIHDDITVDVLIPEGVGTELRRLPGASRRGDTQFVISEGRQQLLTLLWRADASVRIASPREVLDDYRAGLELIESSHR